LDPYYSVAVDHVKKLDIVRQDVGEDLSIAPAPQSENGMYDGHAKFTLDVEGEKGGGRCSLAFLYHGSGEHDFHELVWIFDGKTTDLLKRRGEELQTLPLEEAAAKYPDVTLREAVTMNNLRLVKFLVENGADVNEVRNGRAVLDSAIDNLAGYDIIEYLIDSGAQITNETITSAMMVIGGRNKEIITLLLDRGADVNDTLDMMYNTRFKNARQDVEFSGMTPLICAVCNNDIELVKFLISRGADVNAKCKIEKEPFSTKPASAISALEIARKNGSIEIEKILLEAGASVQ